MFAKISRIALPAFAATLVAQMALAASPVIVSPLPPTLPNLAASPVIVSPLPPTLPNLAASPVIVSPLPPTLPNLA